MGVINASGTDLSDMSFYSDDSDMSSISRPGNVTYRHA